MEVFQCNEQYLSSLVESRSKHTQTKLLNLQARLAKVKELREIQIRNESERQEKKSFELCQLENKLKRIQNETEELQAQKNSAIQKSTKTKQEIDNIKMRLVQIDKDTEQASCRRAMLQHSKEEMEDELMSKWTALVKAYNYYKQHLQCYIQIDDPQVMSCYFYFFTVAKTDNYYVKLTSKDDKWSFSELTPPLPDQAALAEKLAVTNDIQGFLACLMKLFQEHSSQHQLKGQ